MEEIYFAKNNNIIKEIFNINSCDEYLDTDEWVEKLQEYLNNKFISITNKRNLVEDEDYDKLDLELDITSRIPINLQNVIDFFQIGEHVFSLELLVQWFDLFINEISISSDISIYLKNIEIGYLTNKKIVHENDFLPKRNDILEQLYLEYEQELKSKPVTHTSHVKNNSSNYKLNPFLQYKVNKFKNKLKNNKLNKDLRFKINGNEYNFSSNKINEHIINKKKDKKIYSRSIYFDKYKPITDDDINKLKNIIKDNDVKNKKFWHYYNENKIKSKNKINSLFKDDPVIEFDKELFYEKYENKHYSIIYKDIINDLDKLEKNYNNFKIIESYYNKLRDDINITSVFKNENNKISKLFTDYENNRVNEYKVLLEIGNLFVNNKLSKEELKEINSINQNSRPARLLKQSQRVYILEEFINIKNIALSGISNWLRDTSDDNFNILLSLFNDVINPNLSILFT